MYADSNLCAAMRAPKERYHPIIPSKLFFATVSATSETIFTLNIIPLYSKPVLVSFEISGSISKSMRL